MLFAIQTRIRVCACVYARNKNILPNRFGQLSLAASVCAKPRVFEYFITYDPRKRNKLTELRLGDAS